MNTQQIKSILEASILAAGEPISLERLQNIFEEYERPSVEEIRAAIDEIIQDCAQRGVELKELASGFCFQTKAEVTPWIKRLWQERPPRYSRAFLETLAVIAYRQPITRAEIEDLRGVAVSTNIIKALTDREWIRVIGQREVPGRPSIYATTKQFLDYFNLKNLEELPPLVDIRDLDTIGAVLTEAGLIESPEQLREVTAEDATDAGMQVNVQMLSDEIIASDEAEREELPQQENEMIEENHAAIEEQQTTENELVEEKVEEF